MPGKQYELRRQRLREAAEVDPANISRLTWGDIRSRKVLDSSISGALAGSILNTWKRESLSRASEQFSFHYRWKIGNHSWFSNGRGDVRALPMGIQRVRHSEDNPRIPSGAYTICTCYTCSTCSNILLTRRRSGTTQTTHRPNICCVWS